MSGGLFGVGAGELLLILVIVLLVLGPDRLPQLARLWGRVTRFVNKVTRIWAEMNTQITRQLDEEAKPIREGANLKGSPRTPITPTPAPDPLANTILPPELGAQSTPVAPVSQATEGFDEPPPQRRSQRCLKTYPAGRT